MPVTIAIVGRPNVGKSTLFNRLTRARRSITHNRPGVTRDRVARDAQRPAGGAVVIVDTGGFEPDSGELIPQMVRDQALLAVRAADAVILLVDGASGPLPADAEIAGQLRRLGSKVLVAVNKCDRRLADLGAGEFAALGFPLVPISAEHGEGILDLWDALEPLLPPDLGGGETAADDASESAQELAVAIVGRPNVGKSSLLNLLVGEERVLVTATPGTTRDAVDTLVRHPSGTLRLIDTAGIRRRGRTDRGPEVLSVVMARKAIERARVCLIVIDGAAGLTAQDTHVAGLVTDAFRAAVVVINKVDLLADDGGASRRKLAEGVVDRLKFLKDTPVEFISARTGEGVGGVVARAVEVGHAFELRIGTGELNRVLRGAWEHHPPPGGRRPMRLLYATQVSSAPPVVALFTSAGTLHFSYLRYLENVVRGAFPLAGVPIRFIMRGRAGRSR
jgi:GTPase